MNTEFMTGFISFRVGAILFSGIMMLWLEHTNTQGFTGCIHYNVGGHYTWGDTGKMILYQAGDNVCYRINKNGREDIYIAR